MKTAYSATPRISSDGLYLYWLKRIWADPSMGPLLPIIMFNPSTADADVDDPAIRRCMSFGRRENYSGIQVVNLFAFRSSSPKAMFEAQSRGVNIVGQYNDRFITNMVRHSAFLGFPKVLCAWGDHSNAEQRARDVLGLLAPGTAYCLGVTSGGGPKHPLLYVKKNQPLIPYNPQWS